MIFITRGLYARAMPRLFYLAKLLVMSMLQERPKVDAPAKPSQFRIRILNLRAKGIAAKEHKELKEK